ncbi:MAG: hypothetical protein P4L74_03385 [Candidatus Doudnabacteria bacterium]|nr:hypothetical protein [Candidatus Doudnabacteria bacterium]
MPGQFYDDCEICRAMKAAEERGVPLSEKELFAAFEAQKKTGIGMFGTGEDLEKME